MDTQNTSSSNSYDIESIIQEVSEKDSSVLCQEVTSIGDTMEVLRSKWVPAILTAIVCGNTRFTDIQAAVHGLSDKVLKKHLPKLEHMYTATRVSDLKNKSVEQLKALRDIGLNEISLGVESGDDWTLQRIDKGNLRPADKIQPLRQVSLLNREPSLF